MHPSIQISHLPEQGKIIATLMGCEAYLEYNRPDSDSLEICHTFIPTSLKGRGIGSKIVTYAIDLAEQEHLKIKTSCPFADSYFENNPKYKSYLV